MSLSAGPRKIVADVAGSERKMAIYLHLPAPTSKVRVLLFGLEGAMGFEVLTKDEAAERARISRRQLDYQIKAGAGPAVTRIGGAVRVRSDKLEAWLEQCTPSQPEQAA